MNCEVCFKKPYIYQIYLTVDGIKQWVKVCAECNLRIEKENWDRSEK